MVVACFIDRETPDGHLEKLHEDISGKMLQSVASKVIGNMRRFSDHWSMNKLEDGAGGEVTKVTE